MIGRPNSHALASDVAKGVLSPAKSDDRTGHASNLAARQQAEMQACSLDLVISQQQTEIVLDPACEGSGTQNLAARHGDIACPETLPQSVPDCSPQG